MAGQLALETSEGLTTHVFGVWAGKGRGGPAPWFTKHRPHPIGQLRKLRPEAGKGWLEVPLEDVYHILEETPGSRVSGDVQKGFPLFEMRDILAADGGTGNAWTWGPPRGLEAAKQAHLLY